MQDKEAEQLAKQAQLKAKQEAYNLELLRQAEERQQLMDDKDTQARLKFLFSSWASSRAQGAAQSVNSAFTGCLSFFFRFP